MADNEQNRELVAELLSVVEGWLQNSRLMGHDAEHSHERRKYVLHHIITRHLAEERAEKDALDVENARLREVVSQLLEMFSCGTPEAEKACEIINTALANQSWWDGEREIARLTAEVADLKRHWAHSMGKRHEADGEVGHLTDEIEWLRAALQEIADLKHVGGGALFARAALAGEEPS